MKIKIKLIFFSILFVASFLRLFQLGQMPPGISNDEAGYIYNSYSLCKTGKDVSGSFLPLSINLDSSLSPVPVYLASPFTCILGVSPFSGRLPFALLGIGAVIIVFLIAKKLFNNDYAALFSSFVIAISPWHLQISRTAYDGGVALFFYILGFYLFLKCLEKNKSLIWCIPAFILAFYSYHATKIFFIFFIPLLLIIYSDFFLKRKKELFVFSFFYIFIIFSFLLVLKTQNVTRQEMFLWTDPKAEQTVNMERGNNLAPDSLKKLFNNKPLYFLRVIRENYLEAFSTNFLFLYGDSPDIYSVHFRGVMYIIELPLLIFGILFLLRKEKKIKYFVFISLLIAPLPSAFTIDRNYTIRSIMMLPFLSFIAGCGIYNLIGLLKDKKKYICYPGIFIFLFIYLFIFTSYIYQYYFRYRVYGAEAWFGSTKEVISFIGKERKLHKDIYISKTGPMFLLQYAVYNKLDPNMMQKMWIQKSFKIDNVSFLLECMNLSSLSKNTLYIIPQQCVNNKDVPRTVIKDISSRDIWRIYEKN